MTHGNSYAVEVQEIANGILVRERRDGGDFASLWSDWLFYPDIEAVERELVFRLRVARELTKETAKEDF